MSERRFVTHPSLESADSDELVAKMEKTCAHIRAGGMVIMVDDQSRENEGDLVMAAEDVSSETINFMAKEGRGLICLPMEESMIDRLQLPMMSDHSKNIESRKTAFTVSIEAKSGVSTGISAQDRATTIKVAIDDQTQPQDLVVPGHIFPLKACRGGVLTRAGHTEGSVDLVKLAGKKPASVICEIMNDDGTMARKDDLELFSKQHQIPIISIEEIITYRMLFDSYVSERHRERISTRFGEFEVVWFESDLDQSFHVALIKGQDFENHVTEVRVYRQKFLADIFGRSDPALGGSDEYPEMRRVDYGLKMLKGAQRGVYLYLSSRVSEHFLSGSEGSKPALMDKRLYGIGAQILRKLGVRKLILNTISPRPLVAIGGFGLEVQAVRYIHDDGHLCPMPSQQETQAVVESGVEQPQHRSHRFLLIRSSWHPQIIEGLVAGAVDQLTAAGVNHITHRTVPGSYELLLGAQTALKQDWDVIMCFGCIMKGKTYHDQWIYDSLRQGFVYLQVSSQVLIMPCVLHADSKKLAFERSKVGSSGHRGQEAAQAALELLASLSSWQEAAP